ncbi:putative membrane protein [Rhizobium sp. PP-F2F-G48]|uniref:protoporphyrinogen oxidase HemJ n=1 Tax=Rhizobium sp. PP-F2F-G48 TaxID=2135651 RepID=UPI00104E3ADF|nr:protoporphyrinogen oxidase HemJ [Rhizobium sp. PP-F2F-G48]TCM54866.1 putative membrane protein [Rhizobium sp. PP-F2F-G48]
MSTAGRDGDGSRQTDAPAGRKSRLRAFVALSVLVAIVVGLIAWQPADLMLWIKALHVIAVISWMAGLLYMPRLFIYHTDAEPGSQTSETFKVMEQRLLKVIMRPAMMITWTLGLYLAWSVYGFQGGWLHAKILAVILLTAVHLHYADAVGRFSRDSARRTARYWRLMNEVPTVLMIVIVILVIVKPF